MIRVLEYPMGTGWESWDFSAWRREGLEGPHSVLSVPEGELQDSWGGTFYKGNRMKGNGFNLEDRRFRQDIRRKLFTIRHWIAGELQERLWMPTPQRHSRPGLTGL